MCLENDPLFRHSFPTHNYRRSNQRLLRDRSPSRKARTRNNEKALLKKKKKKKKRERETTIHPPVGRRVNFLRPLSNDLETTFIVRGVLGGLLVALCGPYWFPVNRTTNWTVITSAKSVGSKRGILSDATALVESKSISRLSERGRSFYLARLR